MSAPTDQFALTINTEKCGDCVFCVSVCPFEAISVVPEIKKVAVDQSKCRLCGICYATCPTGLIDIKYYNVELLSEWILKKTRETSAEELVIACRGTALTPLNWREKLSKPDCTTKYSFFTIPCLGRMHLKFLLNAIESGVQKISLIACEEEYCRYKDGSKVMANKFAAAQALLEDMGYSADMVAFQTTAPLANVDETKCIVCGTCAFLCPYDAIKIEQNAKLDKQKCKGCGLCVPSCPAIAITLEGFEFETITNEVEDFAAEPGRPKILVLGCQWSEYKYGDEDRPNKNVKFIRMPCSGRIDVLHILKAFSAGIDGVFVAMCSDEICNLENSNKRAQSRLSKLNKALATLRLQERVKICSVHPKYVGMFENELNLFVQRIAELGASPTGGG